MTQKRDTYHRYNIQFRNKTQEQAFHTYNNNALSFFLGPAGTGKTFLATAIAVKEIVESKKSKVILTRPLVESQEAIGYLPGDVSTKLDPYMQPLFEQYKKSAHSVKQQMKGCVEVQPLAYMRGRTFEDAVCILDEAQNCTYGQLKLYLTRLAPDSKYIVTGDLSQPDMQDSGLAEVMSKLRDDPEVGIVEFNAVDIVRHGLVQRICQKL